MKTKKQKISRQALRRRRITIVVCSIILLVFAIFMTANSYHVPKQQTTVTSPKVVTPPQTQSTPSTISPKTKSPTAKVVPPGYDAVVAAASAINDQAQVQFMPMPQMKSVLSQSITPEALAVTVENIFNNAGAMATSWGYSSTAVAAIANQQSYFVQTLKWKIDSVDGNSAKVELFTLTNYQTAVKDVPQPSTQEFGLTVAQMQKMGGKWLVVDTEDPGPGNEPTRGFTAQYDTSTYQQVYDQAVKVYQPVLGGFQDYVNSQ